MPVNKMASRSTRGFPVALRAARFGKTPGNSPGSSAATSGFATYFAKDLSLVGGSAFQLSFSTIGTTTSLKSGLPSLETCT